MYWMPRVPGQKSPRPRFAVLEDRMLRDVRIRRLEHPRNWSQQPPTRSAAGRRVQIEGVDAGGNLVAFGLQMTEWRKRQPRQLATLPSWPPTATAGASA